jgi:DNA-binding LytR/AlgR family response regulator
MKVSIIIEEPCSEPYAEIHTAAVTDEVTAVVQLVTKASASQNMQGTAQAAGGHALTISAWKGDFVVLLKPSDIMRIYSGNKKVFAETTADIYELKYRLYETEALLSCRAFEKFIRISNAEIINLDFVKNFDMSLSGTICVNFNNGKRTFVSRRYISKISERLGLKRS